LLSRVSNIRGDPNHTSNTNDFDYGPLSRANKSILLILHHETTLEKWHLNSPSGYLLKAIDISFHFLLDGHKPSEANKRTNIYYVPMHWK